MSTKIRVPIKTDFKIFEDASALKAIKPRAVDAENIRPFIKKPLAERKTDLENACSFTTKSSAEMKTTPVQKVRPRTKKPLMETRNAVENTQTHIETSTAVSKSCVAKPGRKAKETVVKASKAEKDPKIVKAKPEDEACGWMSGEKGEASDHYWKAVAEERRLALMETFKECEELAVQLDAQRQAYAALQKVVEIGEYFEKVVCDMVDSGSVGVLNRGCQTDLQASDFDEAERATA